MRRRRPRRAGRWPSLLLAAGAPRRAPATRADGRRSCSRATTGRFGEVADVLRERLGDRGATRSRCAAPTTTSPTQVTTVGEAARRRRPAALIVWPIDATSLTPVLDDAADGDIVLSLRRRWCATPAAVDESWSPSSGASEGFLQATALLEGLGLIDEAGRVPMRRAGRSGSSCSPARPRTRAPSRRYAGGDGGAAAVPRFGDADRSAPARPRSPRSRPCAATRDAAASRMTRHPAGRYPATRSGCGAGPVGRDRPRRWPAALARGGRGAG